MNLLLLLSAMLTALSGAGLGVRAPQVPVAISALTTTASTVRVARTAVIGRPVAALSPIARVAMVPAFARWRLSPAAPLYLSRRRE